MQVEVQIIDRRVLDWGFPTYGSEFAAGLDVFACIEAPRIVRPQEPPVLISAGIALHIADPEWCALIVPRSGGGHEKGLVLGNTVGVIDSDYTGPCLVSAWNRNPRSPDVLTENAIIINPGDRIAQLLIIRVARPVWKLVDRFSLQTTRGPKGFGSTGP